MRREDTDNIKKPKSRFAVLFLTILITITTVVSIVDLYLLSSIESFKKYIYIAMAVLVLIWLIFVRKAKKRFGKKRRKTYKNKAIIIIQVIYFIITGIFAGVVTYAYFYLGSFNKTYVTYSSSLIVMSDNKASKIKDIKNYTIGMLKDKTSPDGYIIPKEIIKEHELDSYNTIKKYDSYSAMITDLYSGDLDALFINSSYVSQSGAMENYENLNTDTKVIIKKSKKMLKVVAGSGLESTGKKVTEPFTILLLGVDSTDEGLTKDTPARGDSIILVTFNPKTLNATMLSVPRDSYVPITCFANKAENKITHSAAYGTDCMVKTIENYFDVNIDYYAKINFKGLVHLVDAVGGIDVEVPAKLCTDDSSRYGEVCINEGFQHLDGEGALVLARNRKQLTGGDLARGQNQQLVIKALINKLKDIKNAGKFLKILNTVSNNLDTNFTQSQILSFYDVALDIMNSGIDNNTSDLVNIQQLYLQGNGQMIYDEGSRLVLWNYVPNKDSKKDIIKAMKTNLGLIDHDVDKKFSFSINEEYEKEIIGYGPYRTNYLYDLVPDFTGLSKDAATTLANKNGIKISFTGTSGTVVSQSAPANKRVDKLSGAVTLTLSGTPKEEKKTDTKTTKKKTKDDDEEDESDDETNDNNKNNNNNNDSNDNNSNNSGSNDNNTNTTEPDE